MHILPPHHRAVFLDRDGTLNHDTGYLHRSEDWQWLPGVPEALARLKNAGFLLVVVSNQSGIARGFFDEAHLHALHAWANARLAEHHAAVDLWLHCPHLPEISGPCACRKPAPGLLLHAARVLHIDCADSWMIGDALRDVQAGHAAGCSCVLLDSPAVQSRACALPPRTVCLPNMTAACEHILHSSGRAGRT